MENVRRRAQLDVESARNYSIERFAKEMLGVIDSLEHGLQVAESAHDNAYREGMALTLKLCLDIFEKFGIVCINPEGQPFDHHKHEALTTQVNNDVPPNTVLLVAQKGFLLKDRVLRPARVVVSKNEG
jgi:molecular chaperone GrpE